MIDEEIYDFLKTVGFERWYVDDWVSDFDEEQLEEFIQSVKNTSEFKNK